MPEPTLQIVAAASLGFGAAMFLAGAPRLITFMALALAIFAAGTIVGRERRTPRARELAWRDGKPACKAGVARRDRGEGLAVTLARLSSRPGHAARARLGCSIPRITRGKP